MAAPMFGPMGKPIFGIAGAPLFCDGVDPCCTAECDLVAEFSTEGGEDMGEINFFDESTSTGTIVAWEWDFGDGGTSTLQNPTHTYASAGPFDVTLTVTDDSGCEATIQHTIEFTVVTCGACSGPRPAAIIVTLSGWGVPIAGECASSAPNSCAFLNGTYYLPRTASCVFTADFPKSTGEPCTNDTDDEFRIVLEYLSIDAGQYEISIIAEASDGAPDYAHSQTSPGAPYAKGDCFLPLGQTIDNVDDPGFTVGCRGQGQFHIDAIVPDFTFL